MGLSGKGTGLAVDRQASWLLSSPRTESGLKVGALLMVCVLGSVLSLVNRLPPCFKTLEKRWGQREQWEKSAGHRKQQNLPLASHVCLNTVTPFWGGGHAIGGKGASLPFPIHPPPPWRLWQPVAVCLQGCRGLTAVARAGCWAGWLEMCPSQGLERRTDTLFSSMKRLGDCKDSQDDKGRWSGGGRKPWKMERRAPPTRGLQAISVQADTGTSFWTLLPQDQHDGGSKEWKGRRPRVQPDREGAEQTAQSAGRGDLCHVRCGRQAAGVVYGPAATTLFLHSAPLARRRRWLWSPPPPGRDPALACGEELACSEMVWPCAHAGSMPAAHTHRVICDGLRHSPQCGNSPPGTKARGPAGPGQPLAPSWTLLLGRSREQPPHLPPPVHLVGARGTLPGDPLPAAPLFLACLRHPSSLSLHPSQSTKESSAARAALAPFGPFLEQCNNNPPLD